VLVSPPELVIRTFETLEDSFHERRAVCPVSIVEGEAAKLLTVGVRVIRTLVVAVVGNGGEPGVHDPERVAVSV
jgi:hypothetical protein